MSTNIVAKQQADKKESIFRPRIFAVAGALIVFYLFFVVFYDPLKYAFLLLAAPLFDKGLSVQDLGIFFDIQTNLLFNTITVLSIVSSFLNQRYLGASYKYWLFKHSPDWFTPQENILLMLVNLTGGLIYTITGEYKMIACFSFLFSWYLFIYLLNQIYVYVIKVSHLLFKVRKNLLLKNNCRQWDNSCERIYKKLIAMRCTEANDSYLIEESEIIIQMMIMYRNHSDRDPDSEKVENLKQVMKCLFEHSKRGQDGEHAIIVALESARRERAEKIIDKSNKLPELKDTQYTYDNNRSARENLDRALEHWFPRQA